MQVRPESAMQRKKMDFSPVDRVVDTYYKDSRRGLIPVLHTAQNLYGSLPYELLEHLSLKMGIPRAEITSVVSSYPHFDRKPAGRHHVRICLGTACYLRGGRKLVNHLRASLGVEPGETTPDGRFTFSIVRCIGACGVGPAVKVDDQVFLRVSPAAIDTLLKQFE